MKKNYCFIVVVHGSNGRSGSAAASYPYRMARPQTAAETRQKAKLETSEEKKEKRLQKSGRLATAGADVST